MPEETAIVKMQEEQTLVPDFKELKSGFGEAFRIVDDVVLKNYLCSLQELPVTEIEYADKLFDSKSIRMFKITKMVYDRNESAAYKLSTVFSAAAAAESTIFTVIQSDGQKANFYMGIKALSDDRSPQTSYKTLTGAMQGQFPGMEIQNLNDGEIAELTKSFPTASISSVSCVGNSKNKDFAENTKYIQGLEKFALAMQGKKYTAVIVANPTTPDQLCAIRHNYENVYTQLSPFANAVVSQGTNEGKTQTHTEGHGETDGTSKSVSHTNSKSSSHTDTESKSDSLSKKTLKSRLLSGLSTGLALAGGIVGTCLAGPVGAVVGGSIGGAFAGGVSMANDNATTSVSNSTSKADTTSFSEADTVGESTNHQISSHVDDSLAVASGISNNMQLTIQNRVVGGMLDRINRQLKRIDEFESVGMWECAAYFMSDNPATSKVGAATYKALMSGEGSGVELSAINIWNKEDDETKNECIAKYIGSFIQPQFKYESNGEVIPVSAASLISSNELAIHMGLPRNSVCGFPVVEHADFGKEAISYERAANVSNKSVCLGNVFSMGKETETKVLLDTNSLAMHTFVTGSTGSGKSNAVYEILNQLKKRHDIPFLVIEPAKGEYKNIFGHFPDVAVYGTNPMKSRMIKINPFSFPDDVHVLEHLDRLVEIFNVCWPMYAAMPAILKEAMENAYKEVGWNLEASINKLGRKYPNFADLMRQIETVVNVSQYSGDTKGDYSGALLTRVRSLTTGLNRLIFTSDELPDEELYDKSVIVDLSRVGSTETKSLIMGLLVMKLNEHRMSCGVMNRPLKHITVLEEAHNLLKRVSTEQSSESSNVLGKSVELLANSIAEMRTYGEGFIIADQAPGLLDMSVIRNTNTKIILRLPDKSDRELVGYAAGLKKEQIDELSKLKRGVAAVYQNDWVNPVLVQISKCKLEEKKYEFVADTSETRIDTIRTQLINFLIQGRQEEKLKFSVAEIEQGLLSMGLLTENTDSIKQLLEEYKENGELSIWQDDRLRQLSKLVVDILGVREKVEECLVAEDSEELNSRIENTVYQAMPEASPDTVLALSQCFLKDMSVQPVDSENRREQYVNWTKYITEGVVY